MERRFILGVGLVFLSLILVIFVNEFLILSVEVYPMDVYVVQDEMGFNLDEDMIHFGQVPIYSRGSYREIRITNIYEDDVKVFLSDSGVIDDFVYFQVDGNYSDQYDFILSKNETKSFKVVFENGDLSEGYYDGEIKIVVRKVFKFV